MIRINLLPFRAARRVENIRRQTSIFFLSFLLIGLALFYLNLHLGGRVAALEAGITETKRELAQHEKVNREIEKIKKDLALLNTKLDVINTLDANRTEPVRLLDVMTQTVVEGRMWLTRLESKAEGVHITGMALDNQTVADFMVRLEDCGLFSKVNLGNLKHLRIKEKDRPSADLKTFEITCIKKGTEKPAPDGGKGPK
jgi:type IV pilus assembly protein PilN